MSPSPVAASNVDPVILQYALTLEHLENAFYKKALSMWPQQAFLDAGFSDKFYDQLKYIAHDEEGHVVYLEAGLKAAGAIPVATCEYTFPMTTPQDFVKLASVVEGLGVSAYLGAAGFITSKAYLTAAGSILVTEALHQSATRGAVGEIPMANVFGTPLGLNAVYSIASVFITHCPTTNMALPVMAYPSLALVSGSPSAPGALIDLLPKTTPIGSFYVTFVSGLDIVAVKPQSLKDGMVMAIVPPMLQGQSYAFLTADNSGNLTDVNILAGPAIIEVTPDSPTFDTSITK
ncbi:ferritin-like domain-containing protein [Tricladium varicosporioides]|nr:ferritin-like domain-containing protein [Hymenoscyphus varicosporioides]